MKSHDKDFYIGLNIDDEDQSVSALLLHTLKQLKRDIKGHEIVIEQFHPRINKLEKEERQMKGKNRLA